MPHLTVIPVGNLAEQRDLKNRLHCKPFKWFLDNLATDFLNLYPILDPAEYASGVLQSISSPKLCLDRKDPSHGQPKLAPCSSDHVFPSPEQYWSLTNHRELRSGFYCLEVRNHGVNVHIYQCHGQSGNQFWSFDSRPIR